MFHNEAVCIHTQPPSQIGGVFMQMVAMYRHAPQLVNGIANAGFQGGTLTRLSAVVLTTVMVLLIKGAYRMQTRKV